MTDPAYIDLGPKIGIPAKVSGALWPGGYYELYFELRRAGMTPKEAWSRIESELAAYGLPGKYSSYESFRQRLYQARSAIKAWRKELGETITL